MLTHQLLLKAHPRAQVSDPLLICPESLGTLIGRTLNIQFVMHAVEVLPSHVPGTQAL